MNVMGADFPEGCKLFSHFFQKGQQLKLLREIEAVVSKAPFFRPLMPRTGKPFSVMMTNCGTLGWVSDKEKGYHYEAVHPETGEPWPPIPDSLLTLWKSVADYEAGPEACLINLYRGKAKLGMHRDEDEKNFFAPIVSVSLGDSATFRIGGLKRRDPSMAITLNSGDVLVMGGPSRLRYHGIDRILPGTSDLLDEGGRINLTMRRVSLPE